MCCQQVFISLSYPGASGLSLA